MRSGQALVLVLLVLGVAATVGLSVVSRSVTDVSVSATQDESAKALEAAEAGVERALGGVIPDSVLVPGSVTSGTQTQTYQVKSNVLGSTYYEIPYKVEAGDVVSLDLSSFTGTQVCVYWGDPTVSQSGMEAMLYYDNGGILSQWKGAYSITGSGSFSVPNGGSCPDRANFRAGNKQLIATGAVGSAKLLRVRMVFNTSPQPVAFQAVSGVFPAQGRDILSTGQAGSVTQKLHVVQADPDMSAMFDTALFSGTKLVQ